MRSAAGAKLLYKVRVAPGGGANAKPSPPYPKDPRVKRPLFFFLTITEILLDKIALTREGEYDI